MIESLAPFMALASAIDNIPEGKPTKSKFRNNYKQKEVAQKKRVAKWRARKKFAKRSK